MSIASVTLIVAVAIPIYAYAGYPAALVLLSLARRNRPRPPEPVEWPRVSVTVPVYNEEAVIRGKLDRVLQYDYPPERMQVVVVSDASTDATDDIVREYASRGIDLVRLPRRAGKTAAENAALPHLKGEIVVNSDASIHVPSNALKNLIIWFGDPTVGVVSGRDISVTNVEDQLNLGESGYVGYEMWVRRLETRAYGIIGASGCFYAIRKHLHEELVPEALSRDFAAPLVARERGYRSISADNALVSVARTPSLQREYRRKVRTMTRGIETLFYKRHLLNPFRYGLFAWMLLSHKLVRWLVPWAVLISVAILAMLYRNQPLVPYALLAVALAGLLAVIGWLFPRVGARSKIFSVPAYMLAGFIASLHAWLKALSGDLDPIWEPTRRGSAAPSGPAS